VDISNGEDLHMSSISSFLAVLGIKPRALPMGFATELNPKPKMHFHSYLKQNFFEIRAQYGAQASLKLSILFPLHLNAGITGIHYHSWPQPILFIIIIVLF
jgi:hypothetical protein